MLLHAPARESWTVTITFTVFDREHGSGKAVKNSQLTNMGWYVHVYMSAPKGRPLWCGVASRVRLCRNDGGGCCPPGEMLQQQLTMQLQRVSGVDGCHALNKCISSMPFLPPELLLRVVDCLIIGASLHQKGLSAPQMQNPAVQVSAC